MGSNWEGMITNVPWGSVLGLLWLYMFMNELKDGIESIHIVFEAMLATIYLKWVADVFWRARKVFGMTLMTLDKMSDANAMIFSTR